MANNLKQVYEKPLSTLDKMGEELAFYIRAIRVTPKSVTRYPKEILRLLAEVTLGSGGLAVIGGTVGVITAMTFFTGAQVGLSGYAALNQIGTAAFSGFVSAYFNTREIAPLVAGIALAATVGCGFTAQLGAMRISEEVDALEVMAIPSMPFLVTTRIIAGMVAIIPLYVVGLLSSYFATRLTVTLYYGQSPGTYDHYFNQFLPPGDVMWSFGKVLVFSVVVILIHCYHGYTASGGPAGVGVAVGHAVRTSIVAVNVIDLLLSMAIWGILDDRQIGGLAMRPLDHHRILGVAFIGMLALSVWLVSAAFTQKFVSFDAVTLTTGSAGMQLPMRADVKVRGVIVGQVNKAESEGEGATLTLGIKPDKIESIPSNVTAALVPKTLFGEKYVELNIPQDASSSSLEAGDKIEQTELPIEVERVLNDLYPLLRTVQPAEINYTLNALATALEGRGDKLGESFVTLDSYLKRLNPQIPDIIADIKLLATVTDTYADVMPAIADTLRNTVKTGNTLVSKEEKLNAFLKDLTAFSDTTKAFLDDNGENIIRLGKLSEPILALLDRYSGEFPCLLEGIVRQVPRLADTFRGFIFHINLKLLPQQPRGYTNADRQVYGAKNGPNCAGLPNPPVPYYPSRNLPNLDDGADNLGKGDNQRPATGFANQRSSLGAGVSGTASDKALFNSLTAPMLGVPVDQVSDIGSLLYGPAMAGTEVSVG